MLSHLLVLLAVAVGPNDDADVAALKDSEEFRAEVPNFVYFTLDHIPTAKRRQTAKVLSFVLNSLSRNNVVHLPSEVKDSSHALYRGDLRDYQISARHWAAFCKKAKAKSLEAMTPTLSHGERDRLQRQCGNAYPMVPADWFIVNALRGELYLSALNIGTLDDFRALVGANDEVAKRLRVETYLALVNSNVAIDQVQLKRQPTMTGYIWQASHVKNTKGGILNDPLTDAGEQFEYLATLPNGLHAYFLTDSKHKTLTHGDPKLSVDHTGDRDKSFVLGVSCVRCHRHGIERATDSVRKLAGNLDAVLSVSSNDLAHRIRSAFGTDVARMFDRDQEAYAYAVRAATDGMSPADVAEAVGHITAAYRRPAN